MMLVCCKIEQNNSLGPGYPDNLGKTILKKNNQNSPLKTHTTEVCKVDF